jgi:hypothetical protein
MPRARLTLANVLALAAPMRAAAGAPSASDPEAAGFSPPWLSHPCLVSGADRCRITSRRRRRHRAPWQPRLSAGDRHPRPRAEGPAAARCHIPDRLDDKAGDQCRSDDAGRRRQARPLRPRRTCPSSPPCPRAFGWGTTVWIDPAHDLIAPQMRQVDPAAAGTFSRALRHLVYAALRVPNSDRLAAPAGAITVSADTLAAYAGTYCFGPMEIALQGGEATVVRVFAGGPAAKVGILTRDVVAYSDGAPVKGLSLGQVHGRLRGASRSAPNRRQARAWQRRCDRGGASYPARGGAGIPRGGRRLASAAPADRRLRAADRVPAGTSGSPAVPGATRRVSARLMARSGSSVAAAQAGRAGLVLRSRGETGRVPGVPGSPATRNRRARREDGRAGSETRRNRG